MNSGEEQAAARQEFSPAGNCRSPEKGLLSPSRHYPSRHYNMVYGNEKMPPGLKVLETSPTETYVNDMLCLAYC